MVTLRITAGIAAEVYARELWSRAEDATEPEAMEIYARIEATKATRKDGSFSIEVTDAELEELYQEADYSGDSEGAENPSAGYIKSWAGLKRQIEKVRA